MGIQKNAVVKSLQFSVQGLVEDMEIKTFEGATWAKVFEHNNHGGTVLFSTVNEALKSHTADKFSYLYLLDYFKNVNNKYEFLLQYPDDAPTQYNRWIQKNNPCNEYVTTTSTGEAFAEGYEAVHIDWTSHFWGGMTRQNQSETVIGNCYLSGSVGHTNWFFAIGAHNKHVAGIPSYDSTANRVQFWVRIDNLPEETKCQIMKYCVIANDFYEI